MGHTCPECGGPKANTYAQRCQPCHFAARRNGKSPQCIDCGKKKLVLAALRCFNCSVQYRARTYDDLMRSIWERMDRTTTPNKCWEWRGSAVRGYGTVSAHAISSKPLYVHRLILEQALGRKLQERELALHTCDNPPCCRPDHLFAGSYADNVQDMIAKGRASWQKQSVAA